MWQQLDHVFATCSIFNTDSHMLLCFFKSVLSNNSSRLAVTNAQKDLYLLSHL